jgi:hypothetical protein
MLPDRFQTAAAKTLDHFVLYREISVHLRYSNTLPGVKNKCFCDDERLSAPGQTRGNPGVLDN